LGIGVLSLGGGNAQAAPEDDIEAMLQAVREAWNEEDIETFVSYWTPEGLADQFAYGDEDPVEFIEGDRAETGPIASISVTDLFVTSGNATGIVEIHFEVGFVLYEEWKFYFLDGGWKIGPGEPAYRPIPPGVPAVDLTLQEYAFGYNEAALQAADGNFAFRVYNAGEEEHEVVIFANNTGDAILDVLAATGEDEEFPPGVELVTFGGFFEPGGTGTVVLDQPLSSGKYALVCFLPAPDGTPHAFLGMVSEFTTGSGPAAPGGGGGGITPPSTGDGGLLGGDGGVTAWLLLGLAMTLALGGTAGLVRSRITGA
jgi:hypothetical protein